MKTTTWLLAIAASAVTFQASASDNTITFYGQVANQTCNVSVNGSGSASILLPTVSAAELSSATDVAGRTAFEITVTDCADLTSTGVSTVLVGNNVTLDGYLGNSDTSADKATNVVLEVLENDESTPIDFNQVFYGTKDLISDPSQTSGSSKYFVQYRSTGGTTVGKVRASLQYAVSYL
ncbi:fimbrial protein [Pollutimonas bauzanensis]|jgi:major type 1 subunit fimbrin (pilin)|uniref:fimbrial protein n=1 Tax=Pollutimonas bauzanensis TaxID=658167 RepID=UPI00334173E2